MKEVKISRAVITPTYSGHFGFIEKYLESFDRFLEDRDFPVYFIIEKKETEAFEKIVGRYKGRLNITVCFLEDIFQKYGVRETPAEILRKYGRLSFQTLKKFYGGLYSGADEFFFLDSESMLVKPVNMTAVFEQYFRCPNFFVSRCGDRHPGYEDTFVYNYVCTAADILGVKPEYWSVESYEWFYKREILQDLIAELGEPVDIVRKYVPTGKFPDLEGVLEALLYYLFILKHNDRYGYKVYVVQDEFRKYLGDDLYNRFRRRFDGNSGLNMAGIYEVCTRYIDEKNKYAFMKLFNDKGIQVIRFLPPRGNYPAQKEIVEKTGICIMASEQNHCFGLNATFKNRFRLLVTESKSFMKLQKHGRKFIVPFVFLWKFSRRMAEWAYEILPVLFYSVRFCISVVRNLKIIVRG